MKEFPVANVTLGNGGSLTVAAGKKESGTISITLSPDGLKPETLYLLAIALTQNPVGVDAQGNKQVIYYRVNFREKLHVYLEQLDKYKIFRHYYLK